MGTFISACALFVCVVVLCSSVSLSCDFKAARKLCSLLFALFLKPGSYQARLLASRMLKPDFSKLCLLRSVTKLLEDLVYFVTGGTNSGQDVLEVVFSKPNRERQKLMREQNILKQVSEP